VIDKQLIAASEEWMKWNVDNKKRRKRTAGRQQLTNGTVAF